MNQIETSRQVLTRLTLLEARPVSSGGGVSDGNKGSITVTSGGSTWTINTGAVTNDMLAGSITLGKLTGLGAGVSTALAVASDTSGGFLTAGVGGTLPVSRGGTGATTVVAAREALGIRTFTKPSDQSRSSATTGATYTVDSHLKDIPLESGKSYKIDFFLAAYVPTTEGGKARLVVPLATGTVPIIAGLFNTSQWGNGNASAINQSTSGSVRYFQLAASGGYNQNRAIVGVAYTGVLSASGNLSLEWAQNANGVNATIMRGGSILTVTEL